MIPYAKHDVGESGIRVVAQVLGSTTLSQAHGRRIRDRHSRTVRLCKDVFHKPMLAESLASDVHDAGAKLADHSDLVRRLFDFHLSDRNVAVGLGRSVASMPAGIDKLLQQRRLRSELGSLCSSL